MSKENDEENTEDIDVTKVKRVGKKGFDTDE